jgi:hypothetical protein
MMLRRLGETQSKNRRAIHESSPVGDLVRVAASAVVAVSGAAEAK